MNEIWVLGATGRIGTDVAADLAAKELPVVLVGRSEDRLRALARRLGAHVSIRVAATTEEMARQIGRERPKVVVNTVGPFTETSVPLARACPPESDYVDVGNELTNVHDLLALDDEAIAATHTIVAGAGLGVVGTESVVLKLMEGMPTPKHVRVDGITGMDHAGRIGPTVAATIVESLATGGRVYENGRMVRAGIGTAEEQVSLPGGGTRTTAVIPTGELEAAFRASGAPSVLSATTEAPSGAAVRIMLPLISPLFRLAAVRSLVKRIVARVKITLPEDEAPQTWGRAQIEWDDGVRKEGWLHTGGGMGFTSHVAAEVAAQLFADRGRPGAFTPGALFGPDIAERAGAEFLLEAPVA